MKQIIIFLSAVLVLISGEAAQGQYGRLFSPHLGQLVQAGGYEMTLVGCDEPVSDQDEEISFVKQDFNLFLPFRQNEKFESAFMLDVEAMDIASQARLVHAGVKMPDQLFNVDFGGLARKQLDNGWIAGGIMTFGSASNKPFDSTDEMNLSLTGFVQIPLENKDHHILFLNFASDRDFWPYIPLPGYAYQLSRYEGKLQALLGAPLNWVQWQPAEWCTVEASYIIPWTVHTQVSIPLPKDLTLYGGFDWWNQQWARAGRADEDDRLFYFEKKAVLGLQWDPNDRVTMSLETGYGFDRFFFEGEDYDDRELNRVAFSDGPFMKLNFAVHLN